MVQKKQAFTLVELIVTIVILAILGAIAFISFQGYSRNTRDSARIADINSIQKSLAIFMTKTGFYPTPDESKTITYNGGDAWIEGTIGDNVIKNIEKVNKKPIDPLTSDEFTYSITAGKTEYQLGAISEMAISLNNGINQSYAADISKAKAFIRGTYNEKFLKVETGGIQMLLVQPSIIVTDIGDTDLGRIIQNKKVVYNNYDNIPHSYNHNSAMTGGFDYTPGRGGDIVVLTGATLSLTGDTAKVDFINNVQLVISGTILDGGDEYKPILDLDPTDSTGSVGLVDDYIRNKVGGITGDVSNIVVYNGDGNTGGGDENTSTGEEDIPSTCSLTQTDVDELNHQLGLGNIEVYDINGGEAINPSTESEWCNQVVDLYWYGFENISPSIWKLTNLGSLFLSYNNLTTLPTGIGNLVNLNNLNVGYNSLTSLPSQIGNLTNLQELSLGNNSLTSLPTQIGNLTKLNILAADENQITSIPTEIGNLTKLNVIGLSQNQISSIPTQIGNLTNLTDLSLGSNLLTNLPGELVNLKNLTYLGLSGNVGLGNLSQTFSTEIQTSGLQIGIPSETKAMSIDVAGESLTITVNDLLNGSCGLTLDDLNALNGYISSGDMVAYYDANNSGYVPSWNIEDYLGLKANASEDGEPTVPMIEENWCNKVKLIEWQGGNTFPTGVLKLTKLEGLDLTSNGFTTLPHNIINLTNLDYLGLNGNNLTTLPVEITSLANLENLELGYNGLTTLPEEFANLSNLIRLDLEGNESLGGIAKYYTHYLDNGTQEGIPGPGKRMNIYCNGDTLEITVTQLQACNLTEADLSVLNGFRTSGEITAISFDYYVMDPTTDEERCKNVFSLNWNGGTNIPSQIGKLYNLEGLDISNVSGLTSIPSYIGGLVNLRELSLNGNDITTISSEVGNLTKLKTLALSDNNITSIPTFIGSLDKLQNLYLSNNNLTTLPEQMTNLTKLFYLYLDGNDGLGNLSTYYSSYTYLKSQYGIPGSGKKMLIKGGSSYVEISIINLLSCNLTQTDLDELNGYIGSSELTSEGGNGYLYPSTQEDWCYSTDNLSWYGGSNIPQVIWKLKNLISFNLTNLSLSTLPSDITSMVYLQDLNLAGNNFSSIPSVLTSITSLESLQIRNNNLYTLPSSFGNLVNLIYLDLQENSLQTLPQEFTNLTKLVNLDLSWNNLGNLSSAFYSDSEAKSQYGIPTDGKTMTIKGKRGAIIITVTP